jgi:hypothetical protein
VRRAWAALLITGCSFQPKLSGDGGIDGTSDATPDAPPDATVLPRLVRQANAFAEDTNLPLSATLPALPANGDLLVMIGAAEHGGLETVTGGGVTWTRATRALININIEIWYGVSDGSNDTVTITFPTTSGLPMWMIVTEWSGMASSAVLNDALSMSGTTSPAYAGTLAAVLARDLVIFGASDKASNVFGTPVPAGWTMIDSMSSSVTQQTVWFEIAVTDGSSAPAVSETGNTWDAAVAAFHAAP